MVGALLLLECSSLPPPTSGGSQPRITSVSEDLTPLNSIGRWEHMYTHTHVKCFFKEAKIRCTGIYPLANTHTHKCKRNPRGETIA